MKNFYHKNFNFDFKFFDKRHLKEFLYLLGSPLCHICQKEISFDDTPIIEGICSNCLDFINNLNVNYKRCPICCAFLTEENCSKFHHKNIENVYSLIPLNDKLYKLYLDAKYRKNKNLMTVFSNIFDYFFPQNMIEKYSAIIDYICYVPISFNKKIIRSYNPSKIFSKILSKKLDKVLISPFIEKGFQYFHIQRKENESLFSNRFKFSNHYLKRKKIDITNKNILLVDDIYTTGKTASFLADLLLLNKASKVYLCTLFNHR